MTKATPPYTDTDLSHAERPDLDAIEARLRAALSDHGRNGLRPSVMWDISPDAAEMFAHAPADIDALLDYARALERRVAELEGDIPPLEALVAADCHGDAADVLRAMTEYAIHLRAARDFWRGKEIDATMECCRLREKLEAAMPKDVSEAPDWKAI